MSQPNHCPKSSVKKGGLLGLERGETGSGGSEKRVLVTRLSISHHKTRGLRLFFSGGTAPFKRRGSRVGGWVGPAPPPPPPPRVVLRCRKRGRKPLIGRRPGETFGPFTSGGGGGGLRGGGGVVWDPPPSGAELQKGALGGRGGFRQPIFEPRNFGATAIALPSSRMELRALRHKCHRRWSVLWTH